MFASKRAWNFPSRGRCSHARRLPLLSILAAARLGQQLDPPLPDSVPGGRRRFSRTWDAKGSC